MNINNNIDLFHIIIKNEYYNNNIDLYNIKIKNEYDNNNGIFHIK